ncbi:hypothetical protein D3C76_1210210 [compost metagenome]
MSTGCLNRSAMRSPSNSRTVSPGCSRWNASSQGSSRLRPRSDGADNCNTPLTWSWPLVNNRRPSSRLLNAARAYSRKPSPSAVRRRLRVERANSRAPRCCSIRFNAALATAADRSMTLAAAERLPRSAARTNNCKSSKRSMTTPLSKNY